MDLQRKPEAFGNAQMYLTPFMYDPSAPLNYGEERFSAIIGEVKPGVVSENHTFFTRIRIEMVNKDAFNYVSFFFLKFEISKVGSCFCWIILYLIFY